MVLLAMVSPEPASILRDTIQWAGRRVVCMVLLKTATCKQACRRYKDLNKEDNVWYQQRAVSVLLSFTDKQAYFVPGEVNA